MKQLLRKIRFANIIYPYSHRVHKNVNALYAEEKYITAITLKLGQDIILGKHEYNYYRYRTIQERMQSQSIWLLQNFFC